MLNIIWPFFIIISYIFAIITGNTEKVNNAVFSYTETAVKLTITLLGTMCLWNGLMEIAANTKLINTINKILNPIINFLFPDSRNDQKIHEEISMNITANMLGLGNAATPLGLKAMKSMQEKNENKDRLDNEQIDKTINLKRELENVKIDLLVKNQEISELKSKINYLEDEKNELDKYRKLYNNKDTIYRYAEEILKLTR